MIRLADDDLCRDMETVTREDDGGFSRGGPPTPDLNTLLAREQTSIMNAESAHGDADYERHRNASRQTRQLINATPYPEHEAHVFDRERALARPNEADEGLERFVEENEAVLAAQFSAGTVSAKAYQSRSRFIRQDRELLAQSSYGAHVEKLR